MTKRSQKKSQLLMIVIFGFVGLHLRDYLPFFNSIFEYCR